MNSLASITLIAIPDDDKRWENVEPMTVLGDGGTAYCRESEWPAIREALMAATVPREMAS